MSPDDIFRILTRHMQDVDPRLAGRSFTREDSLRALGLDSMSRVEVLVLTMEELGTKVPLTGLAEARNLGEVADLLNQHASTPR